MIDMEKAVWRRVNDEPFEYAIQQGPHGDEFVKLLDGSCLRRSLVGVEQTWIAVEDRLPEFKQTVLVRYPSGYDLSHVYAFGGRVEGENENGEPAWCWGIKQGYGGIQPGKDTDYNDVECEDDYPVTHWMPLPAPPSAEAKG